MKRQYKLILFTTLLTNSFFYAQTGPGGVGNSTNIAIWLKADSEVFNDGVSTVASDGDNVQEWHDQSGNNRDVIQTILADKPSYVASSATYNGRPSLYFDRTENLENTSFSGIFGRVNSQEISVFAPVQYEAGEASQAFFEFSNGVNFNTGISGLMSGTTLYSRVKKVVGTDDRTSGTTIPYVAIEGHIMDATAHTYWSAGLSLGTTPSGTLENAITHLDIGGIYNSATWRLKGEMPEFIAYNFGVNSAQRKIIENYLAAKYGLTVANDLFAYEVTYGNEVAGIGREDASNIHTAAMSADILQVENPSGLDANNEYLLFGHDNADITAAWTATEAPNGGTTVQRLAREWRFNETGDVGTIDFIVDVATFPALPAGFTKYAIMVDSDGDFSTGADVYEIGLVAGTTYDVLGIDITDGDYVAIGVIDPEIEFTTNKSNGFEPNNATIGIVLNYIPRLDVTVDYATADGTASVAQPDYTGASPLTATILAGSSTGSFTIPINDDAVVESDEDFTITLSNPGSGVALGVQTIHTYTINDDDNARKIYFDLDVNSGLESISPVVNVSMSSVSATDVTVDYAVIGGTATSGAGNDYVLASGTVTILGGSGLTTGSFNFTVNDDAIFENSETIIIELNNPQGCNLDLPVPGNIGTGFTNHTYTIIDNDTPPEIQFTTASASGLESVSPVSINVSLNTTSQATASATYTVTDATAVSPSDYTMASGTVSIAAGLTSTNLLATIVNDATEELPETFTITLSAPLNATLGGNTVFTYTIIDDDNIGFVGPGGVGDISSIAIWLKADSEVYNDGVLTVAANGDDVQEWHDQSGNNRNVSQTVLADKPNYVASSATFNGKPSVYFDGTEIMGNTTFTGVFGGVNSQTASIFAPVQHESGDVNQAAFESSNGVTYNTGMSELLSNTTLYSRFIKSGTNDLTSVTAIPYAAIQSHIMDNTSHTFWSAGVSLATTPSGSLSNTLTALDIGGIHNFSTWRLKGEMPEFITYNIAVNSAHRKIVENYLSAKYGIAIANDYFAYQGTFGNEVAGIGRDDNNNFHQDAQGTGMVRINTPSDLGDGEFLIWGHNNVDPRTGAYHSSRLGALPVGVNNSLHRIWQIDETGDVGTVNVKFDVTSLVIGASADLVLLIDTDDGDFANATVIPLSSFSAPYANFDGINFAAGNWFTLGSTTTFNSLPIELVSFNAEDNKGKVDLTWQTASEINNDFFTVQRSTEGTEWQTIAVLDGAGNSSALLNYATVDSNPLEGLSFYRLKQTDFDGQFTYSKVVSVLFEDGLNNVVLVYPNPTNDKITVVCDRYELGQVVVLNSLGQDVTKYTSIQNQNEMTSIVDLSNLSNGIYFIKTKTSFTKISKK